MCSSLQPVNQATHCAKIVLSAAVGPYNSDRLKWRSSSIHCKYRFGPYVAPNAKNRWTNVLVENSLRLLYEVSQDNGSGGYLDVKRQIQLLVPQLALSFI